LGKVPEEEEWQHRGYGRRLLMEAERIAREEFDAKKILVTSGIGVREYYYSLGYRKDGPYVSKHIS
jgi:elongator complex protein 3